MDRALPTRLSTTQLPQQQNGYPPSPVSPGQSPEYTLAQEQMCLNFLRDMLAYKEDVIKRQNLGLHTQWQQSSQSQADMTAAHEEAITALNKAIDQLRTSKNDLVFVQTQKLQQLAQQHANILAQSEGEARSMAKKEAVQEAEQKAREHEQEVVELNRTFEQEKVEHAEKVDGLGSRVTFLEVEATENAATIKLLRDKNASLESDIETYAHEQVTQTDDNARLKLELATANKSLEAAHTKLNADTAILQTELSAAKAEASQLVDANSSLETKRKLDKIVTDHAEEAQKAAELQVIGLQAEVDILRASNVLLEEAELAAEDIRNKAAVTHQQHQLREQEVADLKANDLILTTQLAACKQARDEQGLELDALKESLETCREDAIQLQDQAQGLRDELEAGQKRSADLAASVAKEKDIVKKVEDKRAKEQSWVKHLTDQLEAKKEATQTAEAELASVNQKLEKFSATLAAVVAEAKEDKAKLLTALQDVKVAEDNNMKQFLVKQAADNELVSTRANLASANQQLSNGSKKIKDLENRLERSQKQPQELRLALDETREKLAKCGSDRQHFQNRAAELEGEARELKEENNGLHKSQGEYARLSEQMVRVVAPSTLKRNRGNASRDRDPSSESSNSPAKRPRMEPDSSAGAGTSPRYNERPSYDRSPRGATWNANMSPLGSSSSRRGRR